MTKGTASEQSRRYRLLQDAIAVVLLFFVCFVAIIQKMDTVALVTILLFGLVIYKGAAAELSKLAKALSERATKISAFQFSIELVASNLVGLDLITPEYKPLVGDAILSGISYLFKQIDSKQKWQFLIVDIGSGRQWLISRLFMFTIMLRHTQGIKCVVFVETTDHHDKHFLGLAEPKRVVEALSKRYIWLQEALVKAADSNIMPILNDASPLPSNIIEPIIDRFFKNKEIVDSPPPQDADEWKTKHADDWEPLNNGQVWEHTKWLDSRRLKADLRPIFYEQDLSYFIDSIDTPAVKRAEAILRRNVPYVALVNTYGEFKSLIDRQMPIEETAKHWVEMSERH
jgi:hypothetical protein